jgi:hypothetical protein
MELKRLPHDPGTLLDFFQQGLEHLGGLCERTWHDQLQVVAEGPAARLWNEEGVLHETGLHFVPAGDTAPRDAAREVFPGCPLTFRLSEALRPSPLTLERALLDLPACRTPPAASVVEKLWLTQYPTSTRWALKTPLAPSHHFSLAALVRCEIQAIDQHWSLHRLAFSLADGKADPALAAELHFLQLLAEPPVPIAWPSPSQSPWWEGMQTLLMEELAGALSAIRIRQEHYLRRELDRIDDYFDQYQKELKQRGNRSTSDSARIKTDERLAAAQAEHARRREDQVQRHEIRVVPHLDALLLLAEPAWRASVGFVETSEAHEAPATFVPRTRRWIRSPQPQT